MLSKETLDCSPKMSKDHFLPFLNERDSVGNIIDKNEVVVDIFD